MNLSRILGLTGLVALLATPAMFGQSVVVTPETKVVELRPSKGAGTSEGGVILVEPTTGKVTMTTKSEAKKSACCEAEACCPGQSLTSNTVTILGSGDAPGVVVAPKSDLKASLKIEACEPSCEESCETECESECSAECETPSGLISSLNLNSIKDGLAIQLGDLAVEGLELGDLQVEGLELGDLAVTEDECCEDEDECCEECEEEDCCEDESGNFYLSATDVPAQSFAWIEAPSIQDHKIEIYVDGKLVWSSAKGKGSKSDNVRTRVVRPRQSLLSGAMKPKVLRSGDSDFVVVGPKGGKSVTVYGQKSDAAKPSVKKRTASIAVPTKPAPAPKAVPPKAPKAPLFGVGGLAAPVTPEPPKAQNAELKKLRKELKELEEQLEKVQKKLEKSSGGR